MKHQRTGADRQLDAQRRKPEATSGGGTPFPCVAGDDARQSAHGREGKRGQLAPQPFRAAAAVVEQEVGGAVQHFAECGAAYRGGDDVVGRGVFALHEELPHRAAADGKQLRLPEVVPVGASGVEEERAVVGVGEHVGAQVVVVPLETVFEILLDAVKRDVGEMPFFDVPVVGPQADVEPEGFCRSPPKRFLLPAGSICRVGRHGGVEQVTAAERLRLQTVVCLGTYAHSDCQRGKHNEKGLHVSKNKINR